MGVCLDRNHAARDCTLTGLAGLSLAAGTVVTGEAALRAISMQNGLARVTYELPAGAEWAACHLFINSGHIRELHEDVWLRCMNPHYGDWAGWIVPAQGTCDRAVVLEASADAVEVSFEWLNYNLNIGYLGTPGLVERNPSGTVNYYDNFPSTPHYITSAYLKKVVRIQRGLRGYYVAWHSVPDMTPAITGVGQPLNNDKDHTGERELGSGPGAVVAWASTGNKAYFPAWKTQRDWSAAIAAYPTLDNWVWWPGIDDAPYSPWHLAALIAMEPPGFPAQQLIGPWYVADIVDVAGDYGGDPGVARVVAQKNPNEIAVWQYAGQSANIVNHLTNPWIEANGQRTRFPVFIGADIYAPNATSVAVAGYTGLVAYGNEPSLHIQDVIAELVAQAVAEWPT